MGKQRQVCYFINKINDFAFMIFFLLYRNEYTWEPTANLGSCKELLEEYEENLKTQRLQKAQAAALQKQYERKKQKGGFSSADILEG